MYRIGKEEIEALARVIESRDLFKINSGACEVLNFEAELCDELRVKHSILMSSSKAAVI